jgi:hypothetical protein
MIKLSEWTAIARDGTVDDEGIPVNKYELLVNARTMEEAELVLTQSILALGDNPNHYDIILIDL